MKKRKRRILAALMAVSAGLLSSCAPAREEGSQPQQQAKAPEGYLEERCSLPENAGMIPAAGLLSDGSMLLLSNTDKMRGYGPWTVSRSADGGETWEASPSVWMEGQGEALRVDAAEIQPDGRIGILSLDVGQETNTDAEGNPVANYAWRTLSPAGDLEGEKTFSLNGEDAMLRSVKQAENGDLICETYRNGVVQLDGSTMAVKYRYAEGLKSWELYDVQCAAGTLYLTYEDTVSSYDLETGELMESFTAQTISDSANGVITGGDGRERVLLPDSAAKTLFYCDNNGVFARVNGGNLVEKVVDSASTSLRIPTRQPLRMLKNGDVFYILYGEGWDYYLARFVYSTKAPQEKTVLKIYSMMDFMNNKVLQAIGEYELQHPEMSIQYKAGINQQQLESDGFNISDAQRALATELLAGKGPDVLLLDYLPIESFIEKGILLDLTDLARENTSSGRWIAPVIDNLRYKDGRIYSLAAGFTVPMMLGEPQVVDAIHSFPDLADWAQAAYASGEVERPIERPRYDYVIDKFFPLCQRAWLKDGAVDRQALAQFLTSVKKISDTDDGEDPFMRKDFFVEAWYPGQIGLACGNLATVNDLVVNQAVLSAGGREGKCALLPGDKAGYYTPTTLIGINAGSALKEQGVAFIETLFSDSVQKYTYFDGLPVNAAMFEKQLTEENPMYNGTISLLGMDGYSYTLNSAWPDESIIEDFRKQVQSLSIPAPRDVEGAFLLAEKTAPYFEEGTALESVIEDYCQVVELKMAE